MSSGLPWLGVGIYTVPQAARITGAPAASIRRWLWGQSTRPLWNPQIPVLDHSRALGFRDLIEIQFVHQFRQRGVSLQTIRRALEQATKLFQESHPLSSLKFKTDGRNILAEVAEDPEDRSRIFDLITGQYLLEIVFDRLYEGLEYSDLEEILRWWPLGKDRSVVLDPRRDFGQPIVARGGVPTSILARAFKAEGSIEAVADWYEVPLDAVRDALEYERELRAA